MEWVYYHYGRTVQYPGWWLTVEKGKIPKFILKFAEKNKLQDIFCSLDRIGTS